MRIKRSSYLRLFGLLAIALALPLAVLLINQKTNFLKRALGEEANLVIDVSKVTDKNNQPWKNLAQGGEENEKMLTSVINETRALSPEYIRLDHIYDHYEVVSRDGSGRLVFNFTKLDVIVRDILATGAKPFFALSYMPPVLSRTGGTTDFPSNWFEWEYLVQQTVEHYSGTSGMNLSNIYYEVWNEPDLFGDFKIGKSSKDYLDLYLHTAIGAQNARGVNRFKIGGPATTALYEAWFNKLLTFTQNNNLRLDFYSWHRYSSNLSDFESDIEKVNAWIIDHPTFSDIELIISETGHSSENDQGYDNYFGAIQTLASAAVVADDLEKFIIFEIKDGPGEEQYWGRWGLLTHEKFGTPVKKPRYSALAFANNMKGESIEVKGEGSWVKAFARDDQGVIRLMVVNYDPYGKHFESVPITFTKLPFQNFTLRRKDFIGGVSEVEVNLEGFNTTYQTQELFSPNSAAIFELIPQ